VPHAVSRAAMAQDTASLVIRRDESLSRILAPPHNGEGVLTADVESS
jgi:hypothetical protein